MSDKISDKMSDKQNQAIKTGDKQTISKQLAKCPFCGGENIKYTYIDWADAIRCYGCGAAMTTPMDFDGNRKEELKNKWNTRKPMERIIERLENDITENPEASLGNYRSGLYKAIEIVKEEGEVLA